MPRFLRSALISPKMRASVAPNRPFAPVEFGDGAEDGAGLAAGTAQPEATKPASAKARNFDAFIPLITIHRCDRSRASRMRRGSSFVRLAVKTRSHLAL